MNPNHMHLFEVRVKIPRPKSEIEQRTTHVVKSFAPDRNMACLYARQLHPGCTITDCIQSSDAARDHALTLPTELRPQVIP